MSDPSMGGLPGVLFQFTNETAWAWSLDRVGGTWWPVDPDVDPQLNADLASSVTFKDFCDGSLLAPFNCVSQPDNVMDIGATQNFEVQYLSPVMDVVSLARTGYLIANMWHCGGAAVAVGLICTYVPSEIQDTGLHNYWAVTRNGQADPIKRTSGSYLMELDTPYDSVIEIEFIPTYLVDSLVIRANMAMKPNRSTKTPVVMPETKAD